VLLQGAFSHFGVAENWDGMHSNGVFHRVPSRILGPTVVTHTENDLAVDYLYALASRLARQVGVGLGGSTDRYGEIGCNGARSTAEALPQDVFQDVGHPYAFQPKKLSNLQWDAYIPNHTHVTSPQVAYALPSAVATK
jgi:hypothetical protein